MRILLKMGFRSGNFDASGNFVEYVRDNEIKDAWLDNVEVGPRYVGLSSATTNDEEEVQELSSKDVAIMKRRIANVLEPEETVSYEPAMAEALVVVDCIAGTKVRPLLP